MMFKERENKEKENIKIGCKELNDRVLVKMLSAERSGHQPTNLMNAGGGRVVHERPPQAKREIPPKAAHDVSRRQQYLYTLFY